MIVLLQHGESASAPIAISASSAVVASFLLSSLSRLPCASRDVMVCAVKPNGGVNVRAQHVAKANVVYISRPFVACVIEKTYLDLLNLNLDHLGIVKAYVCIESIYLHILRQTIMMMFSIY